MQVSVFKSAADFANAAPPPEGFYLRFIERNANGTATEYIKDHTGAVRVLNAGGTGGGASSLSELSDVSGVAGAVDGQALVYDAESATWRPGTVSGGDLPAATGAGQIPVSRGKVDKTGAVFDLPLQSLEAPVTGQALSTTGTVAFVRDEELGRSVAGFSNSAINFSGGVMPTGDGPFTVMFRCKANTAPTGLRTVIAWGTSGGTGTVTAYTVELLANGSVQTAVGGGSGYYITTPGNVFVPTEWNHIAVTHASGGEEKIYVNGALVHTGSRAVNINGISGSIGKWLTSSDPNFTGMLCDMLVFPSVLAAAKIAELSSGASSGFEYAAVPLEDVLTGGIVAVPVAEPDPNTRTVQIKQVVVDANGNPSVTGEVITAFYLEEVPI